MSAPKRTMDHVTNPPHLDLKVYAPHYPYGPNVLNEHDPLAIPLHDRASYERACALFGIAPRSDAEIMSLAEVYEYEEFPPEAWARLARNRRVALHLDSASNLETLREKLAEEEWRREHPAPGRSVPRRPDRRA
jgi:hypothetical protein